MTLRYTIDILLDFISTLETKSWFPTLFMRGKLMKGVENGEEVQRKEWLGLGGMIDNIIKSRKKKLIPWTLGWK